MLGENWLPTYISWISIKVMWCFIKTHMGIDYMWMNWYQRNHRNWYAYQTMLSVIIIFVNSKETRLWACLGGITFITLIRMRMYCTLLWGSPFSKLEPQNEWNYKNWLSTNIHYSLLSACTCNVIYHHMFLSWPKDIST